MSKTDVSFRPSRSIKDINQKFVPPPSIKLSKNDDSKHGNKEKMELIWHNCKLCPPKELFNESLVVTDGVNLYQVRWDQEVGYFGNHCLIEVSVDGAEDWWWADLYQTTTGFFKKIK